MTDKKTSDSWFSTLYTSLGITGVIIMLFTLFVNNNVTLLIVAYTTMLLAVGMIATHIYLKVSRYLGTLNAVSIFTYLSNIIGYMGPLLFYLVILIVSVVAFAKYKENIEENRTSSQYYTFSAISNLFVIIQFIVLWLSLSNKPADEPVMSAFFRALMYLIASINIYVVTIMWYILSTYTTDGFGTLRRIFEGKK